MPKLKNVFGHLKTVLKHKWCVFKLCVKAGITWQGIIHDLSKFSYTEFSESVKYYSGTRSPLQVSKEENGYSEAWLHHKGRNKHHYQYWYDYECKTPAPIIPYKYAVEMVCDSLAAGLVYNGKNWENDTQLNYWLRTKDKAIVHPCIEKFLDSVYMQVANEGLNQTINKKNLKRLYDECCSNNI